MLRWEAAGEQDFWSQAIVKRLQESGFIQISCFFSDPKLYNPVLTKSFKPLYLS
jgi:hypothetical protein